MAKTVLALGVMKALEEGLIRSLEDTAATYVPTLKGSLYGEARLVNLLRMASGVHYVEDYTPKDDRARFNAVARRVGMAEGHLGDGFYRNVFGEGRAHWRARGG